MTGLVLHDVAASRGAGPVVSGVSLTAETGSIVTIVGPNGAGKTSLLEAISGVIPVSAGRVELDGENITRMSRTARFRLGLAHVQQGHVVFPSLTVEENLRLTCRSAEDFDRAHEVFPELRPLRRRVAGLLSGGEQQMLVLARAIAPVPKYLLLDEMSLGLAPVVFTRLLPIIKRVAESGTGVVLVEQFTHLALRIAQEALVLSGGVVRFQGGARELLDDEPLLHRAYLGLTA